MGEFTRDEIEAAWAEYQKRGVQEHDWPGWADMFTDDARYEEHNLGVFEGRSAIQRFIVDIMKEYPAMTLWIEWSIIDGDRIGFYIWNNLPDPTGTGKRYAFPNTTFLRYGGDGKFSFEADYYNPADAERVFKEWLTDGGRRDTPQDRNLRGIDGWNPEPPRPAHPRAEVEAEFEKYRQRAALAVATGDWDQWADQFTDDAHYREHHYGYFRSGAEIRAWIKSVMQPFPTMEFPPSFALIDGNRVSTLIPNILPAPEGDDGYYGFDVNTILHYAGNGKWSFEEDVYSPAEAQDTVDRWIAAGGVLPLELTTTALLVVYAKCVRPAEEAAWDAWEDDVHLPALCVGDGPWAATRFELTARPQPGLPGPGFTHVTIHELDADDARAQAASTLDRDDALRAAGRVHPAHATIAADVFVAHGRYGTKPAPDESRRGHILTHVLCTDPAREAEWDAWYDEQHVPDMLSCGAFSAMSRWRRVPPLRVGPNHLTLYDVATDTVDEAVQRSAATLAEVVAAGRKLDTHTGGLTVTLRPTGRHGGAGVRRD